MTKQDFLNELRIALSGHMGSSAVESHVRYYEEYINSQVRMGTSEEEAVEGLGSPRLIAKSIIDAGKSEGKGDTMDEGENTAHGAGGFSVHALPSWLVVLLVAVIFFAVVALAIAVVWWIAPIILVIWFVSFLVKMMRRQ